MQGHSKRFENDPTIFQSFGGHFDYFKVTKVKYYLFFKTPNFAACCGCLDLNSHYKTQFFIQKHLQEYRCEVVKTGSLYELTFV